MHVQICMISLSLLTLMRTCGCECLLWWMGAAEVMDSESSIQIKSHPQGKITPPWTFGSQKLLCVRLWFSVNTAGTALYVVVYTPKRAC